MFVYMCVGTVASIAQLIFLLCVCVCVCVRERERERERERTKKNPQNGNHFAITVKGICEQFVVLEQSSGL